MEDKLIEYSDKIVEALESGVDFAGEQAPILIQEVLIYYTIFHSIWSIVGFLFTCILVYIGYRIFKTEGFDPDDGDDWGVLLVFVLFSIPSLAVFIVNLINVIKITVAPRLYLIEKLAGLF